MNRLDRLEASDRRPKVADGFGPLVGSKAKVEKPAHCPVLYEDRVRKASERQPRNAAEQAVAREFLSLMRSTGETLFVTKIGFDEVLYIMLCALHAAEGIADRRIAPDTRSAGDTVRALAAPGDTVLVKASRAVGLEVIAMQLLADAEVAS